MATQKKTHTKTQVGLPDFTPSSLLIPIDLLQYFTARAKSFRGTKYYFQHLIVTYGRSLDQYVEASSKKWKNEYQQVGLNLQKKNFKPDPLLWEEFRHIGLSCGLAMCKLFTVLLELEYKRWMEAGCPENFREMPLILNECSKLGMNSTLYQLNSSDTSLKKSLNRLESSILVRKIDFRRETLDRGDIHTFY